MSSADLVTLTVAVVGVGGTMGAPWLRERSRRAEARDQAERDREVRAEERFNESFDQRRDFYAALNSAARRYRSSMRDYVRARRSLGHREADLAVLERAREVFKENYAQAQMVLPQKTLTIAEAVNSSLGFGYRIVRVLAAKADDGGQGERVLSWLREPLSDAVSLLRDALREDLGVIDSIPDLEDRLAAQKRHRETFVFE